MVAAVDGILIHTMDDFDVAMDLLEQNNVVGFDLETTGLSPFKDAIAIVQLYGEQTATCAVFQTCWTGIPERLSKFLSSPGPLFVGHNIANFDLLFLHTNGITWQNAQWYDSLVGESVLMTDNRKSLGKSLAATMKRRLGSNEKKDTSHGHWTEPLNEERLIYAARDVLSLPALYRAQIEAATTSRQLEILEFERQLMPSVVHMVVNGLPVDVEALEDYQAQQAIAAELAKAKLVELWGPINLNSPVQIKRALTASGIEVVSTAEDALIEMTKGDSDEAAYVAQRLLDFRHPNQRIKLFSQWKLKHIYKGRVNGRYWQTGTDTGRFAGSDPNLQQLPRDARFIIRARPGYKIVSVDFSQIEVVACAVIAKDEAMLQVLAAGDIHTWVAARLYDTTEDLVDSTMRKHAKACSFTLIFGGSAKGLYAYARNLGAPMTREQAVQMRTTFFEIFPGVSEFVSKGKDLARKPGPVFLRLPRNWRRMLVGDKKTPQRILNNIVQGVCAAGLKNAIYLADLDGLVEGRLCACVHDELVAEVQEEYAEEYAQRLGDAMIRGMLEFVPGPVKVEVKIGNTW